MILADAAFPLSTQLHARKIVRVYKENETRQTVFDIEDDLRQEAYAEAVTRQRQSVEWGMRALQGSFGYLATHLPVDNERRELILRVILHLHNYRTRRVGLNQIRSVYLPAFERRQEREKQQNHESAE